MRERDEMLKKSQLLLPVERKILIVKSATAFGSSCISHEDHSYVKELGREKSLIGCTGWRVFADKSYDQSKQKDTAWY